MIPGKNVLSYEQRGHKPQGMIVEGLRTRDYVVYQANEAVRAAIRNSGTAVIREVAPELMQQVSGVLGAQGEAKLVAGSTAVAAASPGSAAPYTPETRPEVNRPARVGAPMPVYYNRTADAGQSVPGVPDAAARSAFDRTDPAARQQFDQMYQSHPDLRAIDRAAAMDPNLFLQDDLAALKQYTSEVLTADPAAAADGRAQNGIQGA